ncbi:MAG: hypothetical protein K2Q17_07030 [Nitrospiraceae bacterium]|nr:hypothetical protein [Nitrospiraceae bacterium]
MLAELIHPIAAMDHEEWEFRPRPSNGGPDTCLRKMAYQAYDAPQKDPHGRFLVVLDDSSWHEELVLQWLERTVFHIHSRQLRIACGTTIWKGQPQTINGQIDGIVTDLFGVDRLLEIKAIEHFTFQRYADGAYPTNYFTQVVFYINGVLTLTPDLREALLLIKNKNQSAFLEYRLRYHPEEDRLTVVEITHSNGTHTFPNQEFIGLYRQALTRFAVLETHREAGSLPIRPYENARNFHCDYCPFKKMCWEGMTRIPLAGQRPMRAELIPLAQEFIELDEKLGPLEKRWKDIKQLFQLELRANGVQNLYGGGYTVNSSVSSQNRLDESLLPKELVARSKRATPTERISIKQVQSATTHTAVPDAPTSLAS